MGDSKEIIESFKDGIKNGKKQHLKSSKNRNNSKNNNKVPGLMLSRIEEFIEIGHGENGLRERLLDTCVLKNIKKLFLNKNGENNKENNDILGYSIDNKNKTIIKFNKSPNQLQIEEFIFPGKKRKNNEDYNLNLLNDYSTDNADVNNISENRGDLNFIKKFKDNYQSDVEERIKKHNKVKSNIVLAPKKLKKELKGYKFKNTVFIKPSNINTILDPNSKEKKKIKSHDKEKDNNLRDIPKSNKKEEIKKSKEKDKDKEKDINNPREKVRTIREESKIIKKVEDNNNNIETIRRKKKSKTRKQGKITFLLNRGKSSGKKNENLITSNNNIERKDIDKRLSNNEIINKDYIKKSSKNKIKSNKNNLRASLKSCCFENDTVPKSPKSKKSKRNKFIKFQSVIFPQNNIMLDQKNNKQLGLKNKNSTNLSSKNGEEGKNSENNNSCNEKSIKKTLSSNSEQKTNNKNKHKKQINQNNIKVYKEDINNICKTKNNEIKNLNSSIKNNNDKIKLKDNVGIKNSIKNIIKTSKNNLLNISQYKIKHVNDIYYGKNQIKKDTYKSPIMRIPVFSVVKPEKLIQFEYNRAYERPNNQNRILVNNHKELLNDEKNSKSDSDNDESENHKIKKKSRSVFCCL